VVELLPIEDRVIVREDYYHYPRDRSNVYCLDASLEAVWFAERPSGNDVYSGILGLAEGRLRLYSYDGFTCQVDPGTGRLLEARFTK
jgi:outer membrane protein assembly factor BamB